MFRRYSFVVGLAVAAFASASAAQTPAALAKRYETIARSDAGTSANFSVARGEQFFRATHGSDWSCSTCHTPNPIAPGKHAKTGKSIAPLAPAANPERFTSYDTAEKWFRRNCNDVLGRVCTAQEKGDVLAWLLSLKP